MKVQVKERFKDAKTGQMRVPGEVFDVDDKRGKAMVAAGLASRLDSDDKKSDR